MPPNRNVHAKLTSAEGATTIRTVKELESALSEIFYQRAFDSFLENPAILDLPQFPAIEFCSDETREFGFSIQD